jgi:Stress responsive A/B Barrel Domain
MGTYDMVIVAGFDSDDDYEAYRAHPYHRNLIETVTGPHHRRPGSGPALDVLTNPDENWASPGAATKRSVNV